MMTPHEYIQNILNQSNIVIFSKPMCVLCDKIKKELKDTNTSFLEIDITALDEDDVDSIEVVNVLKDKTKSTSYPFCFQNQEYIELENLIKKLMINNNNNIDSL
jgi:glutaredoxin